MLLHSECRDDGEIINGGHGARIDIGNGRDGRSITARGDSASEDYR